MKKLLTVIGTRPQFIKHAALAGPLDSMFAHTVADTGQHYDHALSAAFVAEFGIRPPDRVVGTARAHPARQLSQMIEALHAIIDEIKPDALLCYGDTNSTLAAGIAAVTHGVPLIHVEAGERNYAIDGGRIHPASMPEETNRVTVDHLATCLVCVTQRAALQLRSEAALGHINVTGDIMYDLFLQRRREIEAAASWRDGLRLASGTYYYATVHRAVNTDDPRRLESILRAFSRLDAPVIFPVHPRTDVVIREHGLLDRVDALRVIRTVPPVGHVQSLSLASGAKAVLTDSGGVMREAYFQGVPSVCLDDSTAWIDLCLAGWSVLAGADEEAILAGAHRARPAERPALLGDGHAIERTLEILKTIV